jgi:hypothetical protein
MKRPTWFEVACVMFRFVGVHAIQAAKGWVRQLRLLER